EKMNAGRGGLTMTENNNNTLPLEYSTEQGQMNIVGFWIFVAAEIALFATLFATYAVLFGRTADSPEAMELFQPGIALVMTFILLTSSFTCGLAIHSMREGSLKG